MQVFSDRNRNCLSLSHGTVLHSSSGSAGDSLARAACRGRLPCSREAQCSDQARDGAVATCREEEARREAELGRAVHKDLVRLGGHARGTPRDLALGHSKRHQGLRREPLASTSMAHSSMRQRWNKRSHRRKRTSSSMTTTTMTMLRIPRARGQLLQKHLQLLQEASTAVAEASEPFPTVAAEVARAERFLYLRCAYGKHPSKP